MQFAAWVVLCLAAAVAFHRRPLVTALAAIVLWCAVPSVAGHWVTGASSGLFAVHPAGVLVLAALAVHAALHPREVKEATLHRPEWTVLLGTVSLVALSVGLFAGHGVDTVAAAVDQVLAPVALFFLLGSLLLARPARVGRIRWWVIGIAAIESALTIVQRLRQEPLVYAADFESQWSYKPYLDRWMGTFDHPLVLSLFLVVALFLLAGVSQWWAVPPLALLLLGGVVVTQSRVGVAFAVAAVAYTLARGRMRWAQRLASAGIVGVAVAVALSLGVAGQIQERIADDSGSTSARADALEYFLAHADEYLWLGSGLNSSFEVSDNAGLGTSFESAALMYSIDLGAVVAIMYFGVMALVVARSLADCDEPGVAGPALAAFAIPQSFSALSGSTAAPMTIWVVFALAGFCAFKGRSAVVSAARQQGMRHATGAVVTAYPHRFPGTRVGTGRTGIRTPWRGLAR